MESLAESRRQIATKLRELRLSRNWTQAELAERLQISQSYLSEIERGAGSLTAEQFLLLLRVFNVPASEFTSDLGEPDLQIRNALARLGAIHLQESPRVLPSEQLEDLKDVVREALVEGSPRVLTALAPVLVRNSARLIPPRFFTELRRLGLERRFAWVIENTLAALKLVPDDSAAKSGRGARDDQLAERHLELCLEILASVDRSGDQAEPPDILDATIRSKQTLEEVGLASSEISQRWGIVTSLQVEDFLWALEAARAAH